MINPNQGNLYKEWIPQNTCINEDLLYKEIPSSPKNKGHLYSTIKTPKALTNEGMHNLPKLWHSRVVKVL